MQAGSSRSVKVFYPARSREEILRALEQGVARLAARVPLVEVVLFGSLAAGRHTVASDIDLLVVHRDDVEDDVFALAKQTIAVRGLEPHVYRESDARALRPRLARMIEGGIRLYPPGR
jgi:predicted nucleotidyltransferase